MARRLVFPSTGDDDTCTGTWSNNSGEFIHQWSLSNSTFQPGSSIKSSTFSPEGNRNITWSLEVCSKISHHYQHTDFDIFLHCTISNGCTVTGNFEISAARSNGAAIGTTVTKRQKFTPNEAMCKLLLKSIPQSRCNYNNYSLVCKIVFVNDIDPIRVTSLKSRISEDYEQLVMSEDFSDITLTVSGKNIPAHKAVLAARSPVFFAMFKHNMKELKTNCVKIDDIEYEVVLETLRFIYTDKAPNLNQMATELLIAADKYGLERLKVMCAETIEKTLNVENALDVWVLSHLHNEDPLKKAAVNFVCENITNMTETASFKSMANSYPDFMIEIVRVLSTKCIPTDTIVD